MRDPENPHDELPRAGPVSSCFVLIAPRAAAALEQRLDDAQEKQFLELMLLTLCKFSQQLAHSVYYAGCPPWLDELAQVAQFVLEKRRRGLREGYEKEAELWADSQWKVYVRGPAASCQYLLAEFGPAAS